MPSDIWNLLIQIPIVAAFIYYTQYMNKQFQTFLKEQREADRVIQREQRGFDREIQKEMIAEIGLLKESFNSHDEKMTKAVQTMQERTRARSKDG